ncbi:MAG: putative endonuclease distantly archaeal Holliday junction resolvase [Parcubacteria group bacterium GW2011_GWA1_47_8]|nr:MAG: putative endonuclease distantly archaeal Holliday junction resolvase [Parcubacteria group bacterium GW2011_GWA1_47_8]
MEFTEKSKTRQTKRVGIGQLGESIAAKYLENKGFAIICRNYRKKYGEIDIIAQNGEILHFVEVKSVSCENINVSINQHRPEDNIHSKKLRRLRNTIQVYLAEKFRGDEPEWVFDAVTVHIDEKSRQAKVKFLENLIL